METTELRKIDLAEFGGLFSAVPEQLTDQELLSMDFLLHQAWQSLELGHVVMYGDQSWDAGMLIALHSHVKQEMLKRGYQHTIQDSLDTQTEVEPPSVDPAPAIPSIPTETGASKDISTSEDDDEVIIEEMAIPEEEGGVDKGIRQPNLSYIVTVIRRPWHMR